MTGSGQLHAVTGAFGYSGKYITRRLLEKGHDVMTLTNSAPRGDFFKNRVRAVPFDFPYPDRLVESLKGVRVLYNTYWVRFNHRTFTHDKAVKNTFILVDAAKKAGVERLVHVSITNPSITSSLEYFHGKARIEDYIKKSGLSHAILRPTVLFGKEDILINNIAWCLRRFPVFGVFGNGEYRLQPIYVDDLAELAVARGEDRENTIIDAIGPETFTFRELVSEIGRIIGKKRPVMGIPPEMGFAMGWIIGKIVDDVLITWEEIQGLMADLLYVNAPPAGKTRLTDWAADNAESLGLAYANELARRKTGRNTAGE